MCLAAEGWGMCAAYEWPGLQHLPLYLQTTPVLPVIVWGQGEVHVRPAQVFGPAQSQTCGPHQDGYNRPTQVRQNYLWVVVIIDPCMMIYDYDWWYFKGIRLLYVELLFMFRLCESGGIKAILQDFYKNFKSRNKAFHWVLKEF